MTGERNLAALLRDMKPDLQDGVYVFCILAGGAELPAGIKPILTFREAEATTVVIRREEARRIALPHQFASRLITLTVHSSLEAIGFLAAITARLAAAGISVNAVSAFHHDHLFVPEHKADEALHVLHDVVARHSQPRPT